METTKNHPPTVFQYLKIALIIVLACIVLFSLDHGMHSPSDFFKPLNLVAFAIYFTPTTIITFLLFRYFAKKHDGRKSTTLALLTGIPLSFALVIITFLLFRS